MKPIYKLITYLFFPGTMAVAGFGLPLLYTQSPGLPWHFWPAVTFCFAVFPVLGLLLLVKLGYLTDIHVYEQSKRGRTYRLAFAGAALGIIYIRHILKTDWDFQSYATIWTLGITAVLFVLMAFNHTWKKISAHMAGTGGFLAACIALIQQGYPAYTITLAAFLLNAMVYAARIGLSAHSHIELLSGFALGFITIFAFLQL